MKLIDNAIRSQLVRSVAVLASGTALAQAITVLASPILTRLYAPEAFGLFATFIALVSTLIPAATGKYEVALMLPRAERAARELYVVAFWFCVVLCSGYLALVGFMYASRLVSTFSELGNWLLVTPLALLFTGIFNLTSYAANRRNQYRYISRSMIIQAAIAVGINIGLGMAGATFVGLIIGNLSGMIVALLYLLTTQWSFVKKISLSWSVRKLALARRYISFPTLNASTGVLDGFTVNLPIFFIVAYFEPEIAGFYALVVRVVAAPLSFISAAVSRVNLKKVIDLANAKADIERYLFRATRTLVSISLLPTLIFIIWGPQLFSLVFGREWLRAGEFSQVLAFALAIRFVSSTLSSTLGATNNNKYGALWKIVAFASTLIVLGLAARTRSIDNFILALVLNDIMLYSLYFYLILLAGRHPRN